MQFSRIRFFGCTRFRARPTGLALFAIPRSEVGLQYSGLTCPAQVSFAGHVLPSGHSPRTWLSHVQSTMPDKTPQGHPAGFPFDSNPPPPSGFPCRCLGPRIVRVRVPLPCRNNCIPYNDLSNRQEPMGLPKFSAVSHPACRMTLNLDSPLMGITKIDVVKIHIDKDIPQDSHQQGYKVIS